MDTKDLPPTGFIRILSVLAPTGPMPFSRSTLYQKIKDGSFPAPIKLGERISVLRVEDVREYIADPQNWAAAKEAVHSTRAANAPR